MEFSTSINGVEMTLLKTGVEFSTARNLIC